MSTFDGTQSIASPPVLEFDAAGNLVHSWGDASLTPDGAAAVLPNSIHGCFVDREDNIWIAGNANGIMQKWTHDGIGVDSSENVYVAETASGRRIQKFTKANR